MRRGKLTTMALLTILLGVTTGCTGQIVQTATGPMPDYCTSGMSNPAGGAIIGSLIGAAIGGAVGGGRGALAGAALGGVGGTLTGAQMDVTCRQYAMQNFMQMMAQQAAAQRAAVARGMSGPVQPSQYVSFDYYAPSAAEGQPPVRRKITQTSSYVNPATKETCGAYDEVAFGQAGSSVTGTGRLCIGADGAARQS